MRADHSSFSRQVVDKVFSVPSLIAHSSWFIIWFVFDLNISLLTNIVSLEAIYLSIFIGISEKHTEHKLKRHIETTMKGGKKK